MKKDTAHLDQYRVTEGEGATTPEDGCNGHFKFKIGDAIIQVNASDRDIEGWEHVICAAFEKPKSNIISRLTAQEPEPRAPNMEETFAIKRLFWDDDESVCEYIPAKGSGMPMCMNARHLWRRTYSDFPMPVKKKVEN